jgi:hypothetical protein
MIQHVHLPMLSRGTPSSQYLSSLEFSTEPWRSCHREHFELLAMNNQCSRYYYASVTYIEELSGVLVAVIYSD